MTRDNVPMTTSGEPETILKPFSGAPLGAGPPGLMTFSQVSAHMSTVQRLTWQASKEVSLPIHAASFSTAT
jgi:hypothetical protein